MDDRDARIAELELENERLKLFNDNLHAVSKKAISALVAFTQITSRLDFHNVRMRAQSALDDCKSIIHEHNAKIIADCEARAGQERKGAGDA